MTFAVHFIPAAAAASSQPFGDPGAGGEGDDQPTALSADEIATWDRLHPILVPLLPSGSHDLGSTEYSRQVVHEPSGLMISWLHDEYQVEVPYWSQNATAEIFDALTRITEAIEADTGLVGVEETSERRFLDDPDGALANFGAVAEGYAEAMDSQTWLGWLKERFRRH